MKEIVVKSNYFNLIQETSDDPEVTWEMFMVICLEDDITDKFGIYVNVNTQTSDIANRHRNWFTIKATIDKGSTLKLNRTAVDKFIDYADDALTFIERMREYFFNKGYEEL